MTKRAKDQPPEKHLWKRGNVYYHRVVVPKDIREFINKQVVTVSLKTSDLKDARARLHVAAAQANAMFDEARARFSKKPVTDLTDTELRQMVFVWFHDMDVRNADLDFAGLDPDALRRHMDTLEYDERALTGGEEPVVMPSVAAQADAILVKNGWPSREHRVGTIAARARVADVDKASQRYVALCGYVLRAMIEAARRSRARTAGQPGEHVDPLFANVGAGKSAPRTAKGVTLGQLTDLYANTPERQHLSRKTKDGYAVVFRTLKQLLDKDTQVGDITRDDCRRVRDILAALPPNAGKRFPRLTLERAAEMARKKGLEPLKPSAVNSYMNNLSALFNWAIKEEYCDKNPATGLRVAGQSPSKRGRTLPFTADQLRAIFNAPLYTGCKDDENGYSIPGPNRPRRGRFWVPLVSLYSGMRLNEVCQLEVADVAMEDNTWVMWVREGEDGAKRVKSDAGRRAVPIHPELRRIGFLRHAERMRDQGETRLFPDLPVGKNGYISDPFSKWFRRFLRKAGAWRARTTFHSFRHTFRDGMREAGVPLERARAIGGWAGSGSADEVYGSGLLPSTLHQEIGKVRYPGLDLSHLHIE